MKKPKFPDTLSVVYEQDRNEEDPFLMIVNNDYSDVDNEQRIATYKLMSVARLEITKTLVGGETL